MKVLLVNAADSNGGAALGAMRLLDGLTKAGIDAKIAVQKKTTNDSRVICIAKKPKFILRVISGVINRILRKTFKTTNKIFHSFNFMSLMNVKFINNFDCDVVNLHWIGGNCLTPRDIAKIKKPIVWTMHDSWPCCGAEHHPDILENDERYKEPYIKKNKPKTTRGFDVCRWVWQRKKKYLSNKKIIFTAPSTWEANVLKQSALFGNCKCYVIPNLLDKNIFCPKNKIEIKKALDIPLNKKIIGFGAAYEINDLKSLKGGRFLLNALSALKNPEDYFLLVFGPANEKFFTQINIPYFATGFISSPNGLSQIYNALDVFVCPSIIENLPFTCLESIFCGTPVAAFNVGGIPDIVENGVNGFLARPYDTAELADCIQKCAEHSKEMQSACLKKATKDFDSNVTIQKFISTFKEAIQEC